MTTEDHDRAFIRDSLDEMWWEQELQQDPDCRKAMDDARVLWDLWGDQ